MGQIHGRGREQTALERELDRAAAGSPGLVLLSGEPGIGKTALLEQLARRMRERGGEARWGTCWDGDGAPAFWPWHRVLSDFGELQAGCPSEDPGHFALFSAVADRLRGSAGPQLVVLDDLQWAGAECLRLLRFVARDLHDCPVLLAGSFRDTDLPADHLVRELAADGGATRLHLPLAGIGAEGIASVVTDLTGERPTDELVHRLRDRTGGNPFFVNEVARLPESELSARLSGPVRDAVGKRVDALRRGTRSLLITAAVIGRDFEDELLARSADTRHEDLDPLLAPAVALHLVEHSAPGRHRFVHDLVREHLLAAAPDRELRRLHRAVHDALAELPDLPARPSRLAAHAVQALPELAEATAVARCEEAADDSERQRLYEEAARHLAAAAQLDHGADEARLMRLADNLRRSGRLDDAAAGYRRLLDTRDPVVRARAALGVHEVGVGSSDTRQPLIHALEDALGALDPVTDAGLVAEVTAALARELADGPQRDEVRAGSLADDAVRVAREHGDPRVLAACLFARHDVIWSPGTAGDRADLGAELCRVADGFAPDLAFQGALCRYVALVELGSPESASALEDVEARAADSGQPLLHYLARTRRDAWDALTGRTGTEERLRASYDLGVRLDVADAYGVFVTQLVCLDLAREDAPAALQGHRDRLGGRLMPPDFAPEERGFELLAQGDVAGAAALAAGVRPPRERSAYRWRALAATAFLADLAWRSGAASAAADCFEQLLPHSGQIVVIGGAVAMVGPVDLYLGLSALASGRTVLGRNYLAAALSQARALGARPWAERIAELLSGAGPVAAFHREGAVWRLEYAGRAVHTPDSKGMADLARLLAQPGEPLSALVLAGGGDGAPQLGSDPVLDETAKASYRRRLGQLDDEIDRATLAGDDTALRQAESERDALVAELTRTAGLAGRARRLGDPGERARSTVTARIRDTLTRIEDQHPELGAHLRASVRTGRECVYAPAEPVRWLV